MRSTESAEARTEYLAFHLGNEQYAIDITRVREIRELERVTRLVEAPAHVQGVINLRGEIVVVTDLRTRFGMPPCEASGRKVMIVIDASAMVGMVVDGVTDVVSLGDSQVASPPSLEGAVDERFVRGIASLPQGMLIVLDVIALLASSAGLENVQ